MGCFNSKSNRLSHLDDSLKVMTVRDSKKTEKEGKKVTGFVPRAPHPLLHEKGKDVHGGHSILCEEPVDIFEKPSTQNTKDAIL